MDSFGFIFLQTQLHNNINYKHTKIFIDQKERLAMNESYIVSPELSSFAIGMTTEEEVMNETEYSVLMVTREVEVVIMSTLFALTLVGNLIVIFILLFYRKSGKKTFLSRMSFYIIHLSLADITVAFLSILPQIIWRNRIVLDQNQALCKFVVFSQVSTPRNSNLSDSCEFK